MYLKNGRVKVEFAIAKARSSTISASPSGSARWKPKRAPPSAASASRKAADGLNEYKMNIQLETRPLAEVDSDALVILEFEAEPPDRTRRRTDPGIYSSGEFTGKALEPWSCTARPD